MHLRVQEFHRIKRKHQILKFDFETTDKRKIETQIQICAKMIVN